MTKGLCGALIAALVVFYPAILAQVSSKPTWLNTATESWNYLGPGSVAVNVPLDISRQQCIETVRYYQQLGATGIVGVRKRFAGLKEIHSYCVDRANGRGVVFVEEEP